MSKKQLLTTIEETLEMPTADMIKACTKVLLQYYPNNVWKLDDDFVYAVGKNPIMLVSHVDTVRDRFVQGASKKEENSVTTTYGKLHCTSTTEKPMSLWKDRNVMRNLNGILGADDRAGVFACLELVRRCHKAGLPLPSVLLTNGEESGGIGVKSFTGTTAFDKHGKDHTFMFVEMDRCNAAEWVNYGSDLPKETQSYIESFGFRKGHGSYSDVRDLQETYLIPGVNLSIGYYSQHSASEVLHLDEMWMTINRVYGMLQEPIEQLYPVVQKKWDTYKGGGYHGNWGCEEYYSKGKNSSSYSDINKDTTSKNVASGKGKEDGSSFSFPQNKAGRSGVDELLDSVTRGGYCKKCGFEWNDCECGNILKELARYCFDAELKFILENYLKKEDPLHTFIMCYLELKDDERVTLTGVSSKEEEKEEPEGENKESSSSASEEANEDTQGD